MKEKNHGDGAKIHQPNKNDEHDGPHKGDSNRYNKWIKLRFRMHLGRNARSKDKKDEDVKEEFRVLNDEDEESQYKERHSDSEHQSECGSGMGADSAQDGDWLKNI